LIGMEYCRADPEFCVTLFGSVDIPVSQDAVQAAELETVSFIF
jgi:hypothetical protein